jgi:hypothetical protein
VQDIPDVRVEFIDAGRLMAAERPQQIDTPLLEVFAENAP